jgi:hypothetical protein
MKLSVAFAVPFVVPLLGLAGCAHPQVRSPLASSSSLTSASITRETTPSEDQTGATAQLPEPSVLLGAWASEFPDAAHLLGSWVKQHQATASTLAQWQQANPVKMKTLIDWSVTDVDDPVTVFLMDRWGWDDLRAIGNNDPSGIATFLGWIRSAPTAATDLEWQSRALRFALRNADSLVRMNPAREMAKHEGPLTWTTSPGRELKAP